jgi:NAD+ synthetase
MIKDYKNATEKIRNEFKTYIENNGLKSIVCGISGGIDSALTVALAKPVCDELNIKLIGRSITIATNKPEEIDRARNIGRFFTTDFEDVDLTSVFEMMAPLMMESDEKDDKNIMPFKIRIGNLKARMRMIYLYDLAAKYRGMVMSTDNYTELMLGFWTLHGDVGDYGLIQNLWKTEVYEMSVYLADNMEDQEAANALRACVYAVPTDGLGITNSDLDQIKAKSYAEVDQILIQLLDKSRDIGEFANHPVVLRKLSSEFKRNNPYNIPRANITSEPLF